jgi:hypothetical protein
VADNGKSLVTGRPEAVAGGEKGPGVVRSLPREDPLRWYDLLYREKVLKLLENALKSREDLEGVLETYLRRVNYLVPAKPKARDLLDALEAVDGWQSPRLALSLYLQKRGNLAAVTSNSSTISSGLSARKHTSKNSEATVHFSAVKVKNFLKRFPKS